MSKGKLIVIEGTDCSGKETQAKMLVDFLNKNGHKTAMFSFPCYDSPTGKIIGGALLGKSGFCDPVFTEGSANVDAYCSSMLFAIDRKYNINKIQSLLLKGYNVVLDRYVDSNIAYHCAKIIDTSEQKEIKNFIETLEYELLKLNKPDYEIFLHMPIWATQILLEARSEKPDQNELNDEYLLRAEECYLDLISERNAKQIECTCANRIKSKEEISTEVCGCVLNFLRHIK